MSAPAGVTAVRQGAAGRRTRRGSALCALAAGLALLCGCQSTSPAQTPSDGGSVSPAAPATASAPAPAASARPMARSVPSRLRIPSIGVDTSVMALGLASDGEVKVPPIAKDSPAGWYDGSPTPGQLGPSVLLGHVTVGAYGDGVFLHLDRLRAGDSVAVTRADGSVATFAVDRVQTVAKSRFPTSSVYGNVDHPELRLITCGGTRISGGGGYPDNVIVYASLVSGS
ncbi:putative lipoprotein [Actinacidiphila reveromycinica]|uniref:Putative lipoprotein n=1 Tax=Actinacidiphila reveromycinica TaxID=659352 RepID=A0A7U3UMK5_9ACTN|nr:class F sortase [Streptomyces sp. SN-593]BBA95294.1 putative lipoprotein [Streptomyces sp. SN-593]